MRTRIKIVFRSQEAGLVGTPSRKVGFIRQGGEQMTKARVKGVSGRQGQESS